MIHYLLPLLGLAFVSLSILAMATDAWRMEIPNYIPLGLTMAFIPFSLLNPPVSLFLHAAIGSSAFLIATTLFMAGWFGGGDVKFLGATALWAGPEMILPVLLIMSFSGVALSLVIAAGQHCGRQPAPEPSHAQKLRGPAAWVHRGACPYGIPIGLAGLVVIAPGAFFL